MINSSQNPKVVQFVPFCHKKIYSHKPTLNQVTAFENPSLISAESAWSHDDAPGFESRVKVGVNDGLEGINLAREKLPARGRSRLL